MKSDELYPYYLDYLSSRLADSKITKSSFSLLKISSSKFQDFKHRFEQDELFREKVIEMHKSEIRDKKIDDIFDETN